MRKHGGSRGSKEGGVYRGLGQSSGNNTRTGKAAPNRVILIPVELRRQTLHAERVRLTTLWESETGCEVTPQPEGPGKLVITKFEIRGTRDKLDKATQKIEEWIRYSAAKTPETTVWAKIPALTARNWYQEHTQKEQDARKKKFLRDMEDTEAAVYQSLITVEWPEMLHQANVTMKDAFGPGLAKLDPIRLDDEVFIKAVGLSHLEIRGSEIKNARSAERRVKVLFEKVHMMNNDRFVYPKYMILDTRDDLGEGVIYERADTWWPDGLVHPIVPRLVCCGMTRSQPSVYWQDIKPLQYYDIQKEVQRALDTARYEKGSYDFSIRLGCLALKQELSSVGTKHKREVFLADITDKKELDCSIKHWLFDDKGGEQLLKRLAAADHLLELSATGTGFGLAIKPESLSDTKCALRGTWIIQDPDTSRSPPSNYVVQIHWAVDEDGLYEKVYAKFYRLDPGRITPRDHIDIKLLELGESKGWQFSLTSMAPVNKAVVPTAIRQFADQIQVNPGYDTVSNQPFADLSSRSSLRLLAGSLDKIYTFDIRKTGYKVDVIVTWYPGTNIPCWGLNVYHGDWHTHLATLEQLRQGECGSWGDTLSTFLPDDGLFSSERTERDAQASIGKGGDANLRDGIRILTTKLMELSQVIYQSHGVGIVDYPAIPPSPRDSAQFQGSLI